MRILITLPPEQVVRILNGEQTVIIRKTALKCELPIEVCIYCTKGDRNKRLNLLKDKCNEYRLGWEYTLEGNENVNDIVGGPYNGKVVAKFTLKKAEKFIQGLNEAEYERLPNFALQDYGYYGLEGLMEKACLNDEEITKYAPDLSFYAYHISDLQIFQKPKEIIEFFEPYECGEIPIPLTTAPKSWRYIG